MRIWKQQSVEHSDKLLCSTANHDASNEIFKQQLRSKKAPVRRKPPESSLSLHDGDKDSSNQKKKPRSPFQWFLFVSCCCSATVTVTLCFIGDANSKQPACGVCRRSVFAPLSVVRPRPTTESTANRIPRPFVRSLVFIYIDVFLPPPRPFRLLPGNVWRRTVWPRSTELAVSAGGRSLFGRSRNVAGLPELFIFRHLKRGIHGQKPKNKLEILFPRELTRTISCADESKDLGRTR